ncbi:hypothetical protein [Paenibacillus massiliensis]|uniref:hypothetical protein n=1 Tax=Paenibacillus massiliensis TaxID=225917 RepID=UPI00035CFEC6|nr:hypothetical protein [Paenibacillus massiliensis]
MSSMLDVSYTWSREAMSATGRHQAHLLVEWGKVYGRRRRIHMRPKMIGCDLRMHLIPEPGTHFGRVLGTRVEMDLNDRPGEVIIHCGNLYSGQSRHALLDFRVDPHPSGRHAVCAVEWSWRRPGSDERTALRSEMLFVHFTLHTGLIMASPNPRVQKFIMFNESFEILRKALRLYERGAAVQGGDMLRRHADSLLIRATRLGDYDYLREAEIFLDLYRSWNETYVVKKEVLVQ